MTRNISIPMVTALLLAVAVIITSADVNPLVIKDKERAKLASDYLNEIKSLSPKTDLHQFVDNKVKRRLTPKAADQFSADCSPSVGIISEILEPPMNKPDWLKQKTNQEIEDIIQQFMLGKITPQEFIEWAKPKEVDIQKTCDYRTLEEYYRQMARAYTSLRDEVNASKYAHHLAALVGGTSRPAGWTDAEWAEICRIFNTRTLITVYSKPENCDVEAAGYAYVNTTPVTFMQTVFGKTYGELRVSKPGYYTRSSKVVMKEGVDNQFTFRLPKTDFWGYFALTVLSAGAAYGFGVIVDQGNLSRIPESQQGFEQYAGAFGIGMGEGLSLTGMIWGIWGMIDGHGGGLMKAEGKPLPQKE